MRFDQASLHELGIKHHTDKATYHGFTVLYDHWLTHLRTEPVRMLEIGVLRGGSLRMWHEYFGPSATIYGADIDPPSLEIGPNVELLFVDQTQRDSLQTMPHELDLIVDDGGHTMLQQQMTLAEMFEHLKPGGTYLLEDLHTSLPDYATTHDCTPANNTLRLLVDLQKGCASPKSEYHLTEADFQHLYDQIQDVEISYVKHNSITSRIRRRR